MQSRSFNGDVKINDDICRTPWGELWEKSLDDENLVSA